MQTPKQDRNGVPGPDSTGGVSAPGPDATGEIARAKAASEAAAARRDSAPGVGGMGS
jgi:hypothetical protein